MAELDFAQLALADETRVDETDRRIPARRSGDVPGGWAIAVAATHALRVCAREWYDRAR